MNTDTYRKIFDIIKDEQFLILRSFSDLKNDLEGGGDIDMLCKDKKSLISHYEYRALSKDTNCYNYSITVDDETVELDLRCIGDNYYDSKWEADMLSNRIEYENFYAISDENYLYSMIYHSLVHKFEIKEKHISAIKEYVDFNSTDELFDILAVFMNEKGYGVVRPLDMGVEYNKSNAKKLKNTQLKYRLFKGKAKDIFRYSK